MHDVAVAAVRTPCSGPILELGQASFADQSSFLAACVAACPAEVLSQMHLRMIDEPDRLLGTDETLQSLRRSTSLRRALQERLSCQGGWDRYEVAKVLKMILHINSEDMFLHVGLFSRVCKP